QQDQQQGQGGAQQQGAPQQGSGDDPNAQQQQGGASGQQQQGTPQPNPLGEVRDAPADCADDNNTEEDWRQAVQQAHAQATARGSGGRGVDRVLKEATHVRVDWESLLMAWAQERARGDYSFGRPNLRYLPMG